MTVGQFAILAFGFYLGFGFFVFIDATFEVSAFFRRKNREYREKRKSDKKNK